MTGWINEVSESYCLFFKSVRICCESAKSCTLSDAAVVLLPGVATVLLSVIGFSGVFLLSPWLQDQIVNVVNNNNDTYLRITVILRNKGKTVTVK